MFCYETLYLILQTQSSQMLKQPYINLFINSKYLWADREWTPYQFLVFASFTVIIEKEND